MRWKLVVGLAVLGILIGVGGVFGYRWYVNRLGIFVNLSVSVSGIKIDRNQLAQLISTTILDEQGQAIDPGATLIVLFKPRRIDFNLVPLIQMDQMDRKYMDDNNQISAGWKVVRNQDRLIINFGIDEELFNTWEENVRKRFIEKVLNEICLVMQFTRVNQRSLSMDDWQSIADQLENNQRLYEVVR